MSNRLDMKKDTNNRKDKTKYDGPEKPDAYMGNDKQWVFRALVLAFVDMCIIVMLCKVTFSCMMNPVESFLLLTWMVTKL